MPTIFLIVGSSTGSTTRTEASRAIISSITGSGSIFFLSLIDFLLVTFDSFFNLDFGSTTRASAPRAPLGSSTTGSSIGSTIDSTTGSTTSSTTVFSKGSTTGSISIFFLTLIGFLVVTLGSFFDVDLPFAFVSTTGSASTTGSTTGSTTASTTGSTSGSATGSTTRGTATLTTVLALVSKNLIRPSNSLILLSRSLICVS